MGSRGFLGKNLCQFFDKNKNYKVFPLSRDDVNFTDIKVLVEKVKFISPDFIIHSAVSLDDFENNLRMYYALENISHMVEKIILVGSGAEYIASRYKPKMNEEYFPQEAVYPSDIYSLSKFTISKLHSISKCTNIYNLRVFGIFGPYEDFKRRLISNNIVRYLNGLPLSYNKNVAFDYLYVEDFLSSLERFLNLNNPKFNTYNLCNGKSYKFKEIMQSIADVVGVSYDKIILRDPSDSDYEYSGDPSRLEDEIGKIQINSLHEAIEKLYKWYLKIDMSQLRI